MRAYRHKAPPEFFARERARKKKYRKNIRLACFGLYGGKCVSCGFADHRALQLDHINDDGHKDRNQYGRRGGFALYQRLVLDGKRDDLQLLCANCNTMKEYDRVTSASR